MFRKFGVAGAVVGAALGAVLMAAPAQAGDHGDHGDRGDHTEHTNQSNENHQLIPVQLCNTNVAVLIAANNSEAEDCVNGPQQANIDK
ncbi:hypothetical protein F4561_000151 [Lipingzhangella halophila]|uniref:Small secreted domain DUF320 n=1 Tax=Lipingzhangella halophila TaxID=1783352 RepID=A0A7W7RC84_9ACTN|nr:hypothetical protein [Lipingzhangella halophila]MBB4929331.1 hypothetical protein [Lipingzhangella halophila]